MKEIIKETKYLQFISESLSGKKTKTIQVINKRMQEEIATIEWYGVWRQYCFFPSLEFDSVWNIDCLQDIVGVIALLMKERRDKNE
jgi:hypothetical protein